MGQTADGMEYVEVDVECVGQPVDLPRCTCLPDEPHLVVAHSHVCPRRGVDPNEKYDIDDLTSGVSDRGPSRLRWRGWFTMGALRRTFDALTAMGAEMHVEAGEVADPIAGVGSRECMVDVYWVDCDDLEAAGRGRSFVKIVSSDVRVST
jgi:hypothetical protein